MIVCQIEAEVAVTLVHSQLCRSGPRVVLRHQQCVTAGLRVEWQLDIQFNLVSPAE